MLKDFNEFEKLVNKVFENNVRIYQKNFTVELGGEIARYTPVDTGHATGNWHGSVNASSNKVLNRYDQSADAGSTKKDIERELSGAKYGDTLYLNNAVRNTEENGDGYIVKLENGMPGGSKQAPHGMVRINIARSKELSKRALKK